jgi:hypothetical protein
MYRHASKVRSSNVADGAKRSQYVVEMCKNLSCSLHALSALPDEDAWFTAVPMETGPKVRKSSPPLDLCVVSQMRLLDLSDN